MQANQTPIVWTMILCSLVLLVAGFMMVNNAKNAIPEMPVMPDVPTAAEIAAEAVALIDMPEAPVSADAALLDKICELTDGCEFYVPCTGHRCRGETTENDVLNWIDTNDAYDDFFDAMVDFTGIDEDYLVVGDRYNSDEVTMKDYQIRAYTESDKDDDNWEIKTFIKVQYLDSDEVPSLDFGDDDAEYAYLVVTSTLDEGDYDELSIEEVDRNFEFA